MVVLLSYLLICHCQGKKDYGERLWGHNTYFPLINDQYADELGIVSQELYIHTAEST